MTGSIIAAQADAACMAVGHVAWSARRLHRDHGLGGQPHQLAVTDVTVGDVRCLVLEHQFVKPFPTILQLPQEHLRGGDPAAALGSARSTVRLTGVVSTSRWATQVARCNFEPSL
ncbi:hypothetical protein [Actinomadura keratinilytica]